MARWKNLDGREEKETVTVNPQEFTVDKFRNYVVQGLKMGIAVGVDSATTVTGCGCFTCLCARSSNLIFFRRIFPAATTFKTSTLNQAGAPISVGCLLRIEVNPSNPSQCQITVRSFDSFWFWSVAKCCICPAAILYTYFFHRSELSTLRVPQGFKNSWRHRFLLDRLSECGMDLHLEPYWLPPVECWAIELLVA